MAQEHEVLLAEQQALARFCSGDPSGFLEISAPDVVYVDPYSPKRLDGLPSLKTYYQSFRGGTNGAAGFELIDPKVQEWSDTAVLTFVFTYHGGRDDGKRWNCVEVYRRTPRGWRIMHTHWSIAQVARG